MAAENAGSWVGSRSITLPGLRVRSPTLSGKEAAIRAGLIAARSGRLCGWTLPLALTQSKARDRHSPLHAARSRLDVNTQTEVSPSRSSMQGKALLQGQLMIVAQRAHERALKTPRDDRQLGDGERFDLPRRGRCAFCSREGEPALKSYIRRRTFLSVEPIRRSIPEGHSWFFTRRRGRAEGRGPVISKLR
jgi:hypothetical protein